jgi:hypothetical protein
LKKAREQALDHVDNWPRVGQPRMHLGGGSFRGFEAQLFLGPRIAQDLQHMVKRCQARSGDFLGFLGGRLVAGPLAARRFCVGWPFICRLV